MHEQDSAQDFLKLLKLFAAFEAEKVEKKLNLLFNQDNTEYLINQFEQISSCCDRVLEHLESLNYNDDAKRFHRQMTSSLAKALQNLSNESYTTVVESLMKVV